MSTVGGFQTNEQENNKNKCQVEEMHWKSRAFLRLLEFVTERLSERFSGELLALVDVLFDLDF